MKKYSLSAMMAAGLLAGGLSVGSANAADLGGDCCADLEERVAELEATTVRKGNRKVSLTISGWVAEQLMYWNDGNESNIYVTGVDTTLSSHFKLSGSAQITPGWSAGYLMHVEVDSNDTLVLDQNTDDGELGVLVLQSYWFVKSDKLGKVSLGKLSHASDNTAILVDGSGSLVPANWVNFDNPAFGLNSGGVPLAFTWGDVGFCHHIGAGIAADCNGVPQMAVRYDSPTFGGFSVSSSWGEDDFWDVAARYAGQLGQFKVAVAGAYSVFTEGAGDAFGGHDVGYFQIGAYAQHVPTGLFFYGAYGHEEVDQGGAPAGVIPDNDHYYLKAGLRKQINPLGHTVFFGEYAQHDDMTSVGLLAAGATGSEVQRWGLGVVQEIDAAAMSIWLTYRNMEGDIETAAGDVDLDDIDIVKFGALINF